MLETRGVPGIQSFQCLKQKISGKQRGVGHSIIRSLEGKSNEKKLRLELVKRQHHSQEPGFRILVIFVFWSMFMFLSGLRCNYKVASHDPSW